MYIKTSIWGFGLAKKSDVFHAFLLFAFHNLFSCVLETSKIIYYH